MSLFDEAETEVDKDTPEPKPEDIAGYRRKKFKGQREELLKDLPHEKKLCTLDEADRFCMKCGSPLKPVSEEFIRSEVQIVPALVESGNTGTMQIEKNAHFHNSISGYRFKCCVFSLLLLI